MYLNKVYKMIGVPEWIYDMYLYGSLKNSVPKIMMYFVGVTSSLSCALILVGELGSKNVY